MLNLRFLLKSHGANFYTVFPKFNGFSENEIPIPIYYENVYNNVMDISSNFKVPKYGSFVNLSDEIQVYQDGTDKDNLASLILLAKYNENETDEEEDIRKRNETKIKVDFIGLRIYRSSSSPFGSPINPGSTFDFGNKPENVRMGDKLDNFYEYSKPADKNGYVKGNFLFDKIDRIRTIEFYKNQRKGFIETLRNAENGDGIKNISFDDVPENNVGLYIVDGLENLSKSLRAPFNMALFYFAPDTYQEKAIVKALNIEEVGGNKQKIIKQYITDKKREEGIPDFDIDKYKQILIKEIPNINTGGKRRRRRRTRGRKSRGRKSRGRKSRARKSKGRKSRGRRSKRRNNNN